MILTVEIRNTKLTATYQPKTIRITVMKNVRVKSITYRISQSKQRRLKMF